MKEEKIFRHYLLAPNRKSYYKDKSGWKEKCIFCSAIKKMKQNKIKAPSVIKLKGTNVFLVAEFDRSIVIVNPYPYVPKGHIEIVPKRHVEDYNELNEKEVDEIFKTVLPLSKDILKKEYEKVIGFNIGINIGTKSGASIEHLHIHVVPRFQIEVASLEVTASTRIMLESAETTMKNLGRYFKKI